MFSKPIFISLVMAVTAVACAANNQADTQMTSKSEKSYVKPGAAVTFSHDLKGQVESGSTEHIVVTITEGYEAGVMTLNVTSDEALQVFAASSQASFDMDASDTHIMNVYFSASEEGRYYLNLMAMTDDGAGQISSRAKSIAVQVGDPAKNTKPTTTPNMQTTSEGQTIVVMDAEETIIE